MSTSEVTIIGNVGQAPETKFSPSGTAVCKFSIATQRYSKEGEGETDWHRITFFGKQAETLAQYVGKGDLLAVFGRLEYNDWTNKDGVEKTSADIIGRSFNFCTKRTAGSGSAPASAAPVDYVTDDDIPF